MMESQAGNKAPEAASQAKLPHLPTPHDTQQEAAKKKRKRETKGKDVIKEGRDFPPRKPSLRKEPRQPKPTNPSLRPRWLLEMDGMTFDPGFPNGIRSWC